jgi:hypothetical protein
LFVSGAVLTGLVAFSVMAYVQRPLRKILGELCGTDERAHFWMVFSNVTVILAAVLAALQYRPEPSINSPAVIEVASQLKWGLVGLGTSLLVLGRTLVKSIARLPIAVPHTQASPQQ